MASLLQSKTVSIQCRMKPKTYNSCIKCDQINELQNIHTYNIWLFTYFACHWFNIFLWNSNTSCASKLHKSFDGFYRKGKMKRIANLHFRNVHIRIFSAEKKYPNLRIHNSETEEPKKPRSIRIKQLGERYWKTHQQEVTFQNQTQILVLTKTKTDQNYRTKSFPTRTDPTIPVHQSTTPFNQEIKNTKNSTHNKRSPFTNPKFTTNPDKITEWNPKIKKKKTRRFIRIQRRSQRTKRNRLK